MGHHVGRRSRSTELEIDTHPQDIRHTSEDTARIAARAMDAKKAHDVVALDVSTTLGVCDWFVIASGASTRQVKAIVDAAEEALHAEGRRPRVREGREDASWVLLDYGDVVVHVFLEETRDFYKLEKLWSDSPRLDWRDAAATG
ncbi:MAG: ribosome silencing factor [Acidimicrobiia bacterium]|nr:ribosome silencing factor [Acidimicrobiia bacterium]